MMLTASLPEVFSNLTRFLWFGFGALAYNVFGPVTFEGYYPTNPIPAFLPLPLFTAIIVFQAIVVWGTLCWWILRMLLKRQPPNIPLVSLAILLWLVPVIFAATTHIHDFALYWIEYAIWRWFGASYVGFSILVALSWTDIRKSLLEYFGKQVRHDLIAS
jgi:hypothetical protein